MSEQHTPGPWVVEKTDGYVVCELTAGWCVVATEADPNKYSPEADARLIAAAPELLAALEDLLDICDGDPGEPAEFQAASRARDAVVKATGE